MQNISSNCKLNSKCQTRAIKIVESFELESEFAEIESAKLC